MSQNGSMRKWFVGCSADVRASDAQGAIHAFNNLIAVRRLKIEFRMFDGKNKATVQWGEVIAPGDKDADYNVTWLTTVVANSPFNAASTARTIQLMPSPGIAYRVIHLPSGKVQNFVRKGNGNG